MRNSGKSPVDGKDPSVVPPSPGERVAPDVDMVKALAERLGVSCRAAPNGSEFRNSETHAAKKPTESPKTEHQTSASAGKMPWDPSSVREGLFPCNMKFASGNDKDVDPQVFEAYLKAIIKEAGCRDVLERMLMEMAGVGQIASCHLLGYSGVEQDAEKAALFANAAAKVIGETSQMLGGDQGNAPSARIT